MEQGEDAVTRDLDVVRRATAGRGGFWGDIPGVLLRGPKARRIRAWTAAILMVSTGLAAVSPAMATGEGELHLVLLGDYRAVKMRTMTDPVDKRWVAVEVHAHAYWRNAGVSNVRMLLKQNLAVDCATEGIDRLHRMINVESDLTKPERWFADPGNRPLAQSPKLENGTYRPVEQLVRQEFEWLKERMSVSDRLKATEPWEYWPTDEEAAVAFGCAVVKRGMSQPQAAAYVNLTLGMEDTTLLKCSADGMGDPGRADFREFAVAFNERKNYVSARGVWLRNSAVVDDKVLFDRDGLRFSISRITGKLSAETEKESGEAMAGTCETHTRSRRF